MAVKSREELIAQISARIGDDTSDEAIALMEDVSDTLNSLTENNGDGKDWKAEAERIDKEWREKYKSRFTSGSNTDDTNSGEKEEPPKPLTFEELFN